MIQSRIKNCMFCSQRGARRRERKIKFRRTILSRNIFNLRLQLPSKSLSSLSLAILLQLLSLNACSSETAEADWKEEKNESARLPVRSPVVSREEGKALGRPHEETSRMR